MQKKHTSGFYRYPYPPSDPRMLNDQKEEYEYEYDHAYRPVRLYHCHNDGERILLLENKYDELGGCRKSIATTTQIPWLIPTTAETGLPRSKAGTSPNTSIITIQTLLHSTDVTTVISGT